jgi:hypothetical protein
MKGPSRRLVLLALAALVCLLACCYAPLATSSATDLEPQGCTTDAAGSVPAASQATAAQCMPHQSCHTDIADDAVATATDAIDAAATPQQTREADPLTPSLVPYRGKME